MQTQLIKLIFDLEVKDDWPPVAAESLWLEPARSGYRVKSFPFFLRGISYDDVVKVVRLDEVHGRITSIQERSGNSTVWVYFREGVNEADILGGFENSKIGYSGGTIPGYYAVNVPSDVPLACFNEIVAGSEEAGEVKVVYGSLRHRAEA